MEQPIPVEDAIAEAKALIHAAYKSTDDQRMDTLVNWAYEILRPLAEAGVPEALWLTSSLSQVWGKTVHEKDFATEYKRRLREAAAAGDPSAQFQWACELDHESRFEESSAFYRAAAAQGHAYAQWCYGLNLVNGQGVPKDPQLGVSYILRSGEGKFEGAIRFLAEAYANGTHGFPKDEEASAAWWKKLSDKALVRY